jgi:L-asparagine transporter-like permease
LIGQWVKIRTQDKNHIREIKIVFHPLGRLAGFPLRASVLWQVDVRGNRNASFACCFCNGYHNSYLPYFRIWSYWLAVKVNAILISVISYNTFIACWWGKYENWFTQEYHIPRGQCTCTLCNVIKFVAVSRFFANYVCTLLIYTR